MSTPGSHGPDQPAGGGGPSWGQPPAGPPGGYSPPPPPPGGATPPPPPPGGFGQGPHQPPQGQPYPPQGQPYPQQGQPYPPQQGQPYPPQGGGPFPPGGSGAPPKSGPPKWLIPVIAGVVLVGGALALFLIFGSDTAEVGDCVATTGVNEVEMVDCDDDSAVAKVVGIEDDELSYREYTSADYTAFCTEFDTPAHYWEGEEGEDGRVVCVEIL